jgi:hypothetical protein
MKKSVERNKKLVAGEEDQIKKTDEKQTRSRLLLQRLLVFYETEMK